MSAATDAQATLKKIAAALASLRLEVADLKKKVEANQKAQAELDALIAEINGIPLG